MSIFDVYNRLRSEIRSRVSPYLQRRYSSSTSPTVRSRSNVISSIPVVRDVHARFIQGVRIGYRPDEHSPPPVDTQKLTPFHRYTTAPVFQRLDQTTGYFQEKIRNWRGVIDRPTPKPIQPLQTFGTHVLHGVASIPQIAGDVVRGSEMFVRHPSESATMAQYGLGIMAGSVVEGFKNRPIQTAGEFTGQMLVLGFLKRGYTRGREAVRYRGRQYISPEQVIDPSVLSGKVSFPVAKPHTSPRTLIQEFKTSKYKHPDAAEDIGGWHATTKPFSSSVEVLPGESSVPGMHIAPSLSTHFTRVSTAASRKLIGFDNPPKAPTGIWVKVKGIDPIPENLKFHDPGVFEGVSKKVIRTPESEWLLSQAELGKAYTTPKFTSRSLAGKIAEKEAIIPVDTPLNVISKNYYTKLHGKKVALDLYEAGSKGGNKIKFSKADTQLVEKVNKQTGEFYDYLTRYNKPVIEPIDLVTVTTVIQGEIFQHKIDKSFASMFSQPEIKVIPTKGPVNPLIKSLSPVYPGYKPLRSSGYEPSGYPGYEPSGYPSYESPGYPGYEPPGYSGYKSPGYPSYESLGYPGYEPPGYPGYEPQGYPGYEPQGYPGYKPPGYSGYEPSGYLGYEPSGYPGYEPPGYPGYELPVYPQPGKPKSPFDFDLKEEFIPRKKKKSSSKESETYPWFPAGLGRVTLEESMTGLPALHIADPGKTRSLHQKYKLTGKEIPTLRQIKIGGM